MTQPVIALCTPLLGNGVTSETFHSTLRLDLPRPFHIYDRREVAVQNARNDIVCRVLFGGDEPKATHLMWIDDDMAFPADAVRRLLAHDLPIVGGLCHGRRAPHYAPILMKKQERLLGGYGYMHDYPQGLVEVDATGAAFLLVKREVFEAIEEKFPAPGEGPFTDRGHGEDVAFSERAKECGYSIFVDTTLEIGHVGTVVVDSAFAKHNRVAEFNPWCPEAKGYVAGTPLATIVIPTWNQEPKLLRAAVESALHQTAPVEVIVVDDGGDDREALAEVLCSYNGLNLRLLRIPHGGTWAALNAGIAAMTTDYFCWLSSDDLYRPNKIERQYRFMITMRAAASFHGYDIMTREGGLTPESVMPYPWKSIDEQRYLLSKGCMVNGLTAMIRKDVFEELGVFDRNYQISSDWELWNRIAQKHLWHPIPHLLATYRLGGATDRYAKDPERRVKWQEEDAAIRAKYSFRCRECGIPDPLRQK